MAKLRKMTKINVTWALNILTVSPLYRQLHGLANNQQIRIGIAPKKYNYHQVSKIRRTLTGKKIVDSDVVGAGLVQAQMLPGLHIRGLLCCTRWLTLLWISRVFWHTWARNKQLKRGCDWWLKFMTCRLVAFRLNAVVIGDLNSWLADLSHFDSEHGTYTVNPDTIHNGHGVQVTNLCHNCDLQPVNHYSNHHVECNGGNTFRLGNTWVSQIDWATRSAKSIQPVEEFNIIKDTMLPTNHTLISLEKKNTRPNLIYAP